MKMLTAISLLVLGNALAWAQTAPAGPRLLDVSHYDIEVEVDPQERFLEGTARVTFKVLENILSVPFDFNNQLSILSTTDQDGNRYSTRFDDLNRKNMRVQGPKSLNPGTEVTLSFRFEGNLEGDEFAFLNVARTEKAVISPDGALLLTEGRWFPQYLLPLDSATAKVSVRVPLGFSAVAPGRLESIRTEGVTEVFNWTSDFPLTEIPVVVSQFLRQTFKEGPIPVSFHVREDFQGDLTPWAQEIGKILEFYNQEYGPSPLSSLDLVSVGKVELETSGSFGLILLESGLLKAKRMPVMELAKRLARHWWGYSVRLKGDRDVFLREGFCTYAALRYMEMNRADDFRAVLALEAVDAMKHQKLATITEGLTFKPGSVQYESIVGSKGAWVLYMLGQLIGRDDFNGYFKEWYQERKDQETGTQDFRRLRPTEDRRRLWLVLRPMGRVGRSPRVQDRLQHLQTERRKLPDPRPGEAGHRPLPHAGRPANRDQGRGTGRQIGHRWPRHFVQAQYEEPAPPGGGGSQREDPERFGPDASPGPHRTGRGLPAKVGVRGGDPGIREGQGDGPQKLHGHVSVG